MNIFFFQAEDGIRDRTVTGVQTCALPIYPHVPLTLGVDEFDIRVFAPGIHVLHNPFTQNRWRSEERRVGKECRYGSRDRHLKEKRARIENIPIRATRYCLLRVAKGDYATI